MVQAQAQQLYQHMEALQQQKAELEQALEGLGEIKSNADVLVPVAPGVFAKGSLGDASELIVNVGSDVMVKKSTTETKSLIQEQLQELTKIETEITNQLQGAMQELGA